MPAKPIILWLYLLNAAVLITHEIDSAYWREWELFGIPGGIQLFLILNLLLVILVLYGYQALIQGRAVGLVFSWLLVGGGLFAVTIHSYFLLQASEAFRLPVSLGLLTATFFLSLAQAVALLKIQRTPSMPFTPKTPYLTTDGIIELYEGDTFKGIVLIERKNDPKGLALPGGFVDVGERVEDALRREMQEETNLDVQISSLLGVYSDPKRDPRFHTASVVFVAHAQGQPKGGDDAKEAKLYALEEIPMDQLVFDHSEILKDYLLQHHTNR
jgi:8-oxo-dGTP diphosphatase